jgi:Fic family protein
VRVGAHVAVSPEALPTFLEHFEKAYGHLGRNDSIVAAAVAAAAAHHRLLWIHPFIDGNGPVARLMSHAMLLDTLDTGGIWSGPWPCPQQQGVQELFGQLRPATAE